VLAGIAALMTVGVYGLVAGIVKLDDAGLHLSRKPSAPLAATGRGILRAAPWLMKFLSVAGTAAMFLVGGGILVHGFHALGEWIRDAAVDAAQRARHDVRLLPAQPGPGRSGAGLAPRRLGDQNEREREPESTHLRIIESRLLRLTPAGRRGRDGAPRRGRRTRGGY